MERAELVVNRTVPGFSVFAEPIVALSSDDEALATHVLQCLQGSWYCQQSGRHVGAVSGMFLEASVGWLPRVTTCRIPPNVKDTLVLTVDGQTYFGKIRLEAQHSITWSTGDVWLKK
ncbi:unnamed protein product [Symbiodinium pilosum]|uniref:Uncharacterized protein n=1 Tax=Symbiodinium pilosum TaxID=2952 RepID=A0A812YFL7_SYMPI|nr:unnamed protein product [Symbiodinium pilosum]